MVIALPTVAEQHATVARVKNSMGPLPRAITVAQRQIDLIREYRTRLISDVVTGKLDVREAAASLPETDPFTADEPTANPETQAPTHGDIPTRAHPHP